jgi:hypothetical protein
MEWVLLVMQLIWLTGGVASVGLMCRADADGRRPDVVINGIVAVGLFSLAIIFA